MEDEFINLLWRLHRELIEESEYEKWRLDEELMEESGYTLLINGGCINDAWKCGEYKENQ